MQKGYSNFMAAHFHPMKKTRKGVDVLFTKAVGYRRSYKELYCHHGKDRNLLISYN